MYPNYSNYLSHPNFSSNLEIVLITPPGEAQIDQAVECTDWQLVSSEQASDDPSLVLPNMLGTQTHTLYLCLADDAVYIQLSSISRYIRVADASAEAIMQKGQSIPKTIFTGTITARKDTNILYQHPYYGNLYEHYVAMRVVSGYQPTCSDGYAEGIRWVAVSKMFSDGSVELIDGTRLTPVNGRVKETVIGTGRGNYGELQVLALQK